MLGTKTAATGSTTLVSRDTAMTGNIEFTGCLEVEGLVKGNISARPGKEAVVRILPRGRVEGEIRSPMVVIDGSVRGDVYATRQLQLASKARVEGNVFYAEAEMKIGAEVNGTFQHIGDKPAQVPADAPAAVPVKKTRASG
jgi:cytoskeletal protein CcmA (bactofilin family)